MDDLKALSAFARVVALGSFRRAAIELGVAPQATSKLVAALESRLGVRLLHRTTRQLQLTEEGARLLAQVAPALSLIRTAMEGAHSARGEVSGTLRVTAPRSVGQHLVLPLIAPFMEQHPDLRVDLELEDRHTDITAAQIDVGFRMGAGVERNVVVRRLMDLQHWICAAPAYIERHGRPRGWEDLARHRCTGFRYVSTGKRAPWEYQEAGGTVYTELPAQFETNDVDAEVGAVLAGIGIGQLPSYVAAPLVTQGLLVRLLARHTTERFGLYVYYAQRAHLPPRARLFIDFVVERLQARERD
jgi:DNA-binding transcriptional LysR family regulator